MLLLGKGLEFEGPVPFKLIKEYIEVLGGIDSELFRTFRKLIFKYYFLKLFIIWKRGFQAIK